MNDPRNLQDSDNQNSRKNVVKTRELLRIKARFDAWMSGFSSSGIEEDEAIERVSESMSELIDLQKP